MRSVVRLNKDLLEWQVFADERIDPVFVLQHGYFLRLKRVAIHSSVILLSIHKAIHIWT